MATVTIAGTPYDVYLDVAAATEYIQARFGPQYSAWMVKTADDKARTLVAATDVVDKIITGWQGTKTAEDLIAPELHGHVWPRTGVVVDDVEIDPLTVPAGILAIVAELAAAIAAKPGLLTASSTGSNIQAMAAGSASISFFARTDLTATRWPQNIEDMLLPWLGGGNADPASLLGGMRAPGFGCRDSAFDSDSDYDLWR